MQIKIRLSKIKQHPNNLSSFKKMFKKMDLKFTRNLSEMKKDIYNLIYYK